MARIKITENNVDEIREELQWHLKSLTLMQEHEYAKQCAPKKVNMPLNRQGQCI